MIRLEDDFLLDYSVKVRLIMSSVASSQSSLIFLQMVTFTVPQENWEGGEEQTRLTKGR